MFFITLSFSNLFLTTVFYEFHKELTIKRAKKCTACSQHACAEGVENDRNRIVCRTMKWELEVPNWYEKGQFQECVM